MNNHDKGWKESQTPYSEFDATDWILLGCVLFLLLVVGDIGESLSELFFFLLSFL